MWQAVIVGIAVLSAVGYLGVHAWRAAKGAGGMCGGCNSCASTNAEPVDSPATFIDVDQLTKSARDQ